ncbi:hypothetical protein JZO66_02640 [Enterococcus sp. DIV0242_7C1]|uniref:BioF2-like acetyltransferase domain-containing protein n=1 Tax=Candidatus Enterococcus dunnyi TaxID=1834192 RepID=A0A200JDJ7_9ENTE|nr:MULTISPECIES: hypothetical protein [unclassified Enterococcus]MBO0469430.1 hypothetical protein [Enterococcus sp. DIV0242_7C1]OUZ35274.1 hypothetical protein A5889_000750 [Enterococcus sp. 9D6_DIV0238]
MMKARLYSSVDFAECPLTKHPLYSYIQTFLRNDLSNLVENCSNADCYALEVGQKLLLVVDATYEDSQTYPTSLRAQYLDYAQEELFLTNIKGKKILTKVFQIIKIFVPKTIDEAVYVGNYLLSTNLFQEFSLEELQEIETLLKQRFPTKTIVYRSQNQLLNQQLMTHLATLNYQPFISRQVFIAHQAQTIKQKKSFNNDRRLAAKTTLDVRTDFDVKAYSERIVELYSQLYITKYSQINPQYTPTFIESMASAENTCFTGIFEDEKLVGVTMSWELDGMLTVPILGYDLSYPKKVGIYRLLTYYTLLRVDETKVFHMSSGVGSFKLSRGAVYLPEYIYFKSSASSRKKYSLWLLQKLNKLLVYISKKHVF